MKTLDYLARKLEPAPEKTISMKMEEGARHLDEIRRAREMMGQGADDTSILRPELGIESELTLDAVSESERAAKIISPEFLFISEMSKKKEVLDGYKIGEPLDEGGMGALFRAYRNGNEFGLKTYLFLSQRENFQRELEIVDRINREIKKRMQSGELIHRPKIIRQVDFCTGKLSGSKSGLTYGILELLEGSFGGTEKTTEQAGKGTKKKTSFLDENGIPKTGEIKVYRAEKGNETRVLMYLWHMAHAIEFIHNIGIAHRDIKYHNSMDKHEANKLSAVLLDFGLALDLKNEEEIRQTKGLALTPKYITKEFLEAYCHKYENRLYQDCRLRTLQTILKRRDYGALALSAYQMLTGISPYSVPLKGSKKSYFNVLDGEGLKLNDYVDRILEFDGDIIDNKLIKRLVPEYGDFFAGIFDTLLNDYELIFRGGIQDKIYKKILGSEVARLHKNLFPPYTKGEVGWLPK